MLSKCANPKCPRAFLYLGQGKLFRLKIPLEESREESPTTPINGNPSGRHRNEFFWLCDSCSRSLTVVWKKGIGVRTIPVKQYRAAS